MALREILLLAIALSMDSMAVSITGGAVINKCTFRNVFKIAFMMGIFQAGMTMAGYLGGLFFAQSRYIEDYDHWIAFILLGYLGGKMVLDSFKDKEETSIINPLNNKVLVGLAIATSIDALAVGVTLALVIDSLIYIEAIIIGLVTFALSGFGVYCGNRFGCKINIKLDLIGGLILIAIGTKIVLEHTIFS